MHVSQLHSQPTIVVESKFDFDSGQEEDEEETEMEQSQLTTHKTTWIVHVIGKHFTKLLYSFGLRVCYHYLKN